MRKDEIERELAKRLEAEFMKVFQAPPQPRTALRVRGGGFEVVELDDAGKVIEPLRCICGSMIIMHRPNCPFYCLTT